MERGYLCKSCPIGGITSGYAISDGTGKNGVLILAEALGKEEAAASLPLVGPTGKLLNRMIERTEDPETGFRLKREDFLLTNVLRCRPPDNKLTGEDYEERAIEHCSPYLDEFLRKSHPKAILALGNQPLKWLTGHWGIESLRGYVFKSRYGPVIPTYHPAYIMRGKFPLADVWRMDLKKALYVARHGAPEPKLDYLLYPSPMEVERWCNQYLEALKGDPTIILAADIETLYKSQKKDEAISADGPIENDESYTIKRISFSYEPFKAITFPWIPPFISTAKRILASSGAKVFWNGDNFDVPRLVANDCPPMGPVFDAMQAWHFLQPALPMGLKYAATFYCPEMGAWKLESGTNPEFYSAADSDVLLRCWLGIVNELKEEGRWEAFDRHFFQLAQVLARMSKRGIRVDSVRRHLASLEFKERFNKVVEEIQPLIPFEALPIEKVFKIDEEALRKPNKAGEVKWREGRMKKVRVFDYPPKPRKPKKEKKAKKEKEIGEDGKPKGKRGRPRKPKVEPPSPDGLAPSLIQKALNASGVEKGR